MTDNPSDKIIQLMGKTTPAKGAGSGGNTIFVEGSGNFVIGGDVNMTPEPAKREVVKIIPEPGVKHITEPQKVKLRKLVDDVVATEQKLKKRPKTHAAVWKALNSHCDVSSYHIIALEDFEKARTYLHTWSGRLNSAKSAPAKNADAWRNKRYAYIKINTKDPIDADALAAYIKREFKASSIKELANDELERAYKYVAGRRNRRR